MCLIVSSSQCHQEGELLDEQRRLELLPILSIPERRADDD